jgi:hypothetical protein
MEQEILQKLQEQQIKLEAIQKAVVQTRNYIKWTVIASVVLFVLPLIGMVFAIPAFMQAIGGSSGLGLGL